MRRRADLGRRPPLHRLGVDEPCLAGLGGKPFDRVEFARHAWPALRRVLPHPGGWTVPRARLDQALRDRAQAAGAQVLYEMTAIGVIQSSAGRWTTTVRDQSGVHALESDAIVVASGAGDALPRRLGVCGEPLRAASIRGYVATAGDGAPVFSFLERKMIGYAWCFPMADGTANVGVCSGSPLNVKRLRPRLDRYLADRALVPIEGVIGGAGTLWSGRGRTWHQARGLVSCGDAGGLVDPMTGEGISGALESGGLAGNAVAAFLESGDETHLERVLESDSRLLLVEIPAAARQAPLQPALRHGPQPLSISLERVCHDPSTTSSF